MLMTTIRAIMFSIIAGTKAINVVEPEKIYSIIVRIILLIVQDEQRQPK